MSEQIKISEGTVEKVKEVAARFGYDIEQSKKDFITIIQEDFVKDLESKEEVAVEMLQAKYASSFDRPTQEYDAYVIDIAKPVTIISKGKKMRIGNVYCLAINPNETDKKPRFAKIAHFDQTADKVLEVEKGQFYKVRLSGGIEGTHYKLSATDATNYQKQDKIKGFENPTEVIKKLFPIVEIAEASMKIGTTEMFLVEGQVTSARVIPRREQEGCLGIYKITDPSIIEDLELLEEMRGGMTIFVDEDQVKCGYLSKILALGRFSKNERDGIVQMNGEIIIPIIPTPFEKPQEEVSLADAGITDENKEEMILSDEEL